MHTEDGLDRGWGRFLVLQLLEVLKVPEVLLGVTGATSAGATGP